jgi:hypothetical protein
MTGILDLTRLFNGFPGSESRALAVLSKVRPCTSILPKA